MIAPHGLLHSRINLRGATLVTFGPLWIVAHTPYNRTHTAYEPSLSKYTPPREREYCTPYCGLPAAALKSDSPMKINAANLHPHSDTSSEGLSTPAPNTP